MTASSLPNGARVHGSHNSQAPMNRQQQLALRLATMPMLAGLAGLGAWTVFGAQPLLYLGYGCLVLGVAIAMFVPFVLLRGYSQTPNVRNTIMISVLAIANLPVTFFCALEGVSRATRYRVTLRNQSETPWLEVQLMSTGMIAPRSSIAANSEEVRDVWFEGDGQLQLHYVENDKPTNFVIEGYVTKRQSGAATVVRDPGGQVRLDPK